MCGSYKDAVPQWIRKLGGSVVSEGTDKEQARCGYGNGEEEGQKTVRL